LLDPLTLLADQKLSLTHLMPIYPESSGSPKVLLSLTSNSVCSELLTVCDSSYSWMLVKIMFYKQGVMRERDILF